MGLQVHCRSKNSMVFFDWRIFRQFFHLENNYWKNNTNNRSVRSSSNIEIDSKIQYTAKVLRIYRVCYTHSI